MTNYNQERQLPTKEKVEETEKEIDLLVETINKSNRKRKPYMTKKQQNYIAVLIAKAAQKQKRKKPIRNCYITIETVKGEYWIKPDGVIDGWFENCNMEQAHKIITALQNGEQITVLPKSAEKEIAQRTVQWTLKDLRVKKEASSVLTNGSSVEDANQKSELKVEDNQKVEESEDLIKW